MLENIKKPCIRVRHTDLERTTEGSLKSECPTCKGGVLPMHRNEQNGLLQRHDNCIVCGQPFYYTDATIFGQPFEADSADREEA